MTFYEKLRFTALARRSTERLLIIGAIVSFSNLGSPRSEFIQTASAQQPSPSAGVGTPSPQPVIELPLMRAAPLVQRLVASEFPPILQPIVTSLLKTSEAGDLDRQKITEALSTLAQSESAALNGPSPQRYYFLKGLLQYASDDASSASQSLSQALRLRASDPDAVLLKGLTQLSQKKSLEGLDSIKEAQWFGKGRFFPEAEALYAQAVGYSQLGNVPKTAESLSAAIASPSASPAMRVQLSKLELARGNVPAALKAARDAASAEGSESQKREANVQLVRVLLASPDQLLDGARISEADRLSAGLFEKAPAASQEAREILPLRVKSLLATRKPEAAEKLVLAALKKTPGDAELERLLKQVSIEKAAGTGR
jgi:hypothetical protein